MSDSFIILSGGALMKDYGNEIAEFLYYAPGSADKRCALWPVRAGTTATKPGYSAGPKKIESYSLHFVSRGQVHLEYEGGSVVLNAGNAFCLYPMRTYTYRSVPSPENLEMSWLVLDGPGAEGMLDMIGFKPETPFVEGRPGARAQGTLKRILSLLRNPSPGDLSAVLRLQSLLYRLFAKLAEGRSEPADSEQAQQGWLKRSLEYIELHAAEGISVTQAAEAAGVSRTHFSSAFSEHTGMSPALYIAQVRLDKAKRMLADTAASVTEIAYSLGYSSVYAFTRAFKHRYALTPTDYRAAARGLVVEPSPRTEP